LISKRVPWIVLASLLFLSVVGEGTGQAAKKKKPQREKSELFAAYVWPPPPDEAKIRLEAIFRGRADLEGSGKVAKWLIGRSPKSPYDDLKKPFAVAFDPEGRILVTDWQTGALLRFDRKEERYDVLGTQGRVRLKAPMGLAVSDSGDIYVADTGLRSVIAFGPEGDILQTYGKAGELTNPTDAALSPDGQHLLVADSKAHQIVVFDVATAEVIRRFGERGDRPGQFAFPTSLVFGPEGNLFIVDQINSRVQVLTADGEYLDEFGNLGVGFGDFVRPKDIAVDEVGFIYVTDNAFNNVQLFDIDFSLLTFVGEGGMGPGQFQGASGVAVRGSEFAVVDQLGRRVQLFRFIGPKLGGKSPPAP
jgi:DNA-binding beta-propeller fold protein YncE